MTLAALLVAVALAAAVQLVSGFGFALTAAPVLVAVTDPVTSVSILSVLGIVISVLALTTSREPTEILWRESAWLLAWALPGIVAGALLIDRLDDDAVRAAVGALVLAALAQRHVASRRAESSGATSRGAESGGVESGGVESGGVESGGGEPGRGEPRDGVVARGAAGLTAGAMTTSTALNGPPLVVYLTSRGARPRAARDTLALLFVVLDAVAVGALAAAGNLHLPVETLALPVAALAGVLLGHQIFDRLSDRARTKTITATLVVAALTALGAALA